MSDISLGLFYLSPEWIDLFEKLPGWERTDSNVLTDGRTFVKFDSETAPKFGFIVHNHATWLRLQELFGENNRFSNSEELIVQTPARISVTFQKNDYRRSRKTENRLYMNHVALNVLDIAAERQWFEQILGSSVVLARDSVWEPVLRSFVKDVHLFRSPHFYITLRESQNLSGLSHVGWMTLETEEIDRMADIVQSLKWEIVYGPTEIDGSYLFHFNGPDGEVHDFYCPLSDLLESGETTDE